MLDIPVIDCKIWPKYKNKKRGYGYTFYKGQWLLAHRVEWIKHYGEIPKDKVIMHSCDNPSCYEIRHLQLGTLSDNMIDMVNKGRGRQPNQVGINHSQVKLTDQDIILIRLLNINPKTLLAALFDISPAQICRIRKNTSRQAQGNVERLLKTVRQQSKTEEN